MAKEKNTEQKCLLLCITKVFGIKNMTKGAWEM